MHFDALAAACMTQELNNLLCPGRIQQVLLIDANSIGLEVYAHGARHQLLVNVQPGRARLHLVEQKLRRGAEADTPLLLLLRKYVRDAALVGVAQPDPWERVLHLRCEHKEFGASEIVVELLGRQSNLFLANGSGRILGALHHVQPGQPGEASRRALQPGRNYTPPTQAKLPPLDDGRPDYYERLAAVINAPGKLAKVLADGLAGVSPSQARELAWRMTGDAEAPAAAANVLALVAALQSLWLPLQTGEWQPGNTQVGEQISGFYPYRAQATGEFVPAPTFSAAVAAYFAAAPTEAAAAPVLTDPYAAQRAAVRAELRRATQQVQRRLAGLAADEPAPGEAERLRRSAEWLLALHSQVQPGQAQLVAPVEDEPLVITLDPKLTPVAQAQQMFKRAGKLERAADFIPQRRAQLEQDLALLEQLGYDLEQAANQPEIAAVRGEAIAAGLVAQPKPQQAAHSRRGTGKSGQPLRFRSPAGFEIVVGRNARQNEQVTFAIAHPNDWWLHVRSKPGAHVVVRGAGREPDQATLRTAAQLAAYYSSARGERSAEVILARRRWVSRAPGGKVGQVLVEREETVAVAAELPAQVEAAPAAGSRA